MSTEARHAPIPPRPSHNPTPPGADAPEGESATAEAAPGRTEPGDTPAAARPTSGNASSGSPGRPPAGDGPSASRPASGGAPSGSRAVDGSTGSGARVTGGGAASGSRVAGGTGGASAGARTVAGDGSSGTRTATGGAPAGVRRPSPPVRPNSGAPGDGKATRPGSGGPGSRPDFPYVRPAFAARHPSPTAPPAPTAPPPPASARFPDAPPTAGREPRETGTPAADRIPSRPGHRPTVPPRPARPPAETPSETTARLRRILSATKPDAVSGDTPRAAAQDTRTPTVTAPVPTPDPALSWSAAVPAVVTFGQAEGYDERGRPRPLGARVGPRTAAAAACFVLGLGLIGGAVTGSWLTGDGGSTGPGTGYAAAADLWHSVPVDDLFPPTVEGTGAGPGGADRTWTRIAVAPDSGCADAFDPLLRKALAPVGCRRLLRATYTDATQSYVTTVGLLFTKADPAAMSSLARRFQSEGLGGRTDLMPRPYAAKGTVAAAFGDKQRASWSISVLTDAPVVAYAVSGWADGRTVDDPQPAAEAIRSGATSAPAQAGLGNEAQGLADRIERRLRKTVSSASESPS
ncbi:hypothetical protein ABZ915_20025 [Streptomyces sp. NPDC046915]|uniref:hypothetical protein n=1 Tax=Streptomyces sp. NPDC046915 TaxID=3155257 RepID=UPI0033F0B888